MNKKDLKDLIKPLVKECIEETVAETILTSGILSQVITEVLKGVSTTTIVEKQTGEQTRMSEIVKQSEKRKIDESKKQLLNTIGKTSYGGVNVFEGIGETIPEEKPALPPNLMQGISPNDPGVDITQLFDFNKAKVLAQGKKRRK